MTAEERTRITGRPVLLYDGVCALCNGVVRFALKHDRAGMFRFAPLESGAARELMGESDGVEGVVLVTDALVAGQQVYRRSDAVAEALRLLGGGWRAMGRGLEWVPRVVREAGYGAVARVTGLWVLKTLVNSGYVSNDCPQGFRRGSGVCC